MSATRHETIHRLFTEAVRLSGAERVAFLSGACPDDAVRTEVEAMLVEDARAGGTFDAALDGGGAAFLADALARNGDLDAEPPPLPERLGKYRILREIGAGGMGVVYEAEQDEPRRRVALKVVRTSLVTRGLLQRFRHEARVLGHLRHPGIAQIYEAGSADTGAGGQPYFAMELVEGTTILDYAETHRLDTAARLELIAQLCDILEYAHQKGVIHRDIKPANILVTAELSGMTSTTAGQPLLKVLDFGVARATDADLNTVTLQTTVGQLVGTVPYMSPEQASGDPAEIDSRSDVYSVGVLGWELLAGRLPYAVRGKMVHEAVRVIREEDASRLSAIDRSWRGDVETIFAKALAKEKERRYQTAGELARDIRRHLAHQPIEARRASTSYQLRKFARRNKVLVAGVVATLIVAIAGAAIAAQFAVAAMRASAAHQRTSYIAGLAAAAGALETGDEVGAADYLDALPMDHRGWEYRHLCAQLEHTLTEWASPEPAATAWAGGEPVFDASGERLFVVLEDRSIGVWDMATGRFLRTVTFERGPSSGTHWRVVMHGPSARFATTAPDGAIAIHDLETGARLERLAAPDRSNALAWDADGRRLLFGNEQTLFVWDGSESRALERTGVTRAVFARSGDRIFGSSNGGTIKVFDASTGSLLRESISLPEELMLAPSPDGALLAAFGLYGNDYLLDARTLDVVAPIRGHREAVMGVVWDGSRLITRSADRALQIRDTTGADPPIFIATGVAEHGSLGRMPGGNLVMADSKIRLLPVGDPVVLRGHESFVYRVVFSPDGRQMATAGLLDRFVFLWDVASGRLVRRLPAPSPSGYAREPLLAFSHDGRRLVATTLGRETRQWDLESFERLDVVPGHSTIAHFVATLGHEPTQPHFDYTLMTSPDDRLAARVHGATVELFDVAACGPLSAGGCREPQPDAVPIHRLVGHSGAVMCIAFSPDGTRIATGSADATVRIWDAHTYEQLLVLKGHEDYVKAIAFSPDGTLLVSGSGDSTVRLWDTLPLRERRASVGRTGD